MMDEWKVTIETWPYHSVPQEQAGERVRIYTVQADGISDALRMAKAISLGVNASPAVWQAPITAIVKGGR